MKVYPIFLTNLATRRCVVIGNGPVAEYKVMRLLEADAAITIISPELTDQLRRHLDTGTLAWLPRPYEPGDLRGAYLAVVTDHDAQRRARIWEEAQAERVLVSMVDDVAHSTFIAGSIVRQGALTVAISTSGCAPALAVRLRQRLERELGPEYAAFLELMRQLREPLAAHVAAFKARQACRYALVDADILEQLRRGRPDKARQRIAEIVGNDVLATADRTNRASV